MLAKLALVCATTGYDRQDRLRRAWPLAPCPPSTECSRRQSSSAPARPDCDYIPLFAKFYSQPGRAGAEDDRRREHPVEGGQGVGG